jgi:hypothetical protein
MSSIGLIFKADNEMDKLLPDWVPSPLGARNEVLAAIEDCLSIHGNNKLALDFSVDDENAEPITISVVGVWGDDEKAALKHLCDLLVAHFYDSEAGDFVDL